MKSHLKAITIFCFAKYRNAYIEMHYDILQSKKPLLLWVEISYSEVSNDQSKLLNNFFI
jgi:hypothetical protein